MIKFLIAFLLLNSALAAISGDDDRHEIIDAPVAIQKLSNSIAALVRKENVIPQDDGSFKLLGQSYVESLNFCGDARFVETQTIVANCSAFLVGPNKIGTAGHCIEHNGKVDISGYYAIFDYKVTSHNQEDFIISKEQIFELKDTTQYIFNFPKDKDVAVIELDRVVENRTPLTLSKDRVEIGEEVFILGFPFGLAMKYQDNGSVTRIFDSSFSHDLDVFSVNSGSAIFSADTNEIVGILVRGIGQNMERDPDRNCNVWGGEISKGDYSGEGNLIELLKP
ncbi:serine protease [Halobacteriovorax sp. HLS]|uniref:trypsin-like serine peptidase n=1 Tax=Halobacteriovorax sp. HLS TaxID=2234000 RepID=UPI000FD90A09|nr:serine protease [Halobacteriovorax sp. HLS]